MTLVGNVEQVLHRRGELEVVRHVEAGRQVEVVVRLERAEALVNSLSMALPFEPAEKQALLEADTLREREKALVALLEIDAAISEDDDLPLQ